MAGEQAGKQRVIGRRPDLSSRFARSQQHRGLRAYYVETLECGCETKVHFSRCELLATAPEYDDAGDLKDPLTSLGPAGRRCPRHSGRSTPTASAETPQPALELIDALPGSVRPTHASLGLSVDERPVVIGAGPVPTWRRVSRQQLADLLGVHPDTIWRLVKEGMPILRQGGSGRGDESVFDSVAALAWWRDRLPGPNAKAEAQLEKLKIEIQLAQQKLSEQQGDVVPIAEVKRDVQAHVRGWRQLLLNLPRQLVQVGIIQRDQAGPVDDYIRNHVLGEIALWKSVGDVAAAIARLEREAGAA